MVQQGKLKVLVDKIYKLEEAREALAAIEDRRVFGKIVVAP
jgi:alcohol dehydrogenase